MRIDNISNNNFEGKFVVPSKLSAKEQKFAEELINYEFCGITNGDYLKDKNFDVNIFGRTNRQCHHGKLSFQIGIKHIGTKANERGMDIKTIKADTIRLDEGIVQATCRLRNLIDKTDDYINKNLQTQYNTNFQKFIVKAKMFLGII